MGSAILEERRVQTPPTAYASRWPETHFDPISDVKASSEPLTRASSGACKGGDNPTLGAQQSNDSIGFFVVSQPDNDCYVLDGQATTHRPSMDMQMAK